MSSFVSQTVIWLVPVTIATLLGGCSSDRGLAPTDRGYLASSVCAQRTTESTCAAEATGCQWVATDAAKEGGGPAGGCVANDPCLQMSQSACAADSGCAWSVGALCPLGATCTSDGGFCHAKDASGGDCACVSPLTCPADGDCPQVECDCSGGGSGGSGGACSCTCAPCAAGEVCPPCACACDDGGPNCGDTGTCACACPACAPGESCPPCDCVCSGGATTVGGGGGSTVSDPCSVHEDATACSADTANACVFYAFGAPCVEGQPCKAGVCQTSKPSNDPTCDCACPDCPPGAECAPCTCDCGGSGGGTTMSGCVPPPQPTDPIACPAIGCATKCPNGEKLDASGCPTCECL